MIKTKTGMYQSELLSDASISHGFSTKQFGDMRDPEKRKIFLSTLGLADSSLVEEEQIHREKIHLVLETDRGKTIQGVDGLVYKQSPDDRGVALSVHTADCVPLLMVDLEKKIIGVAHAGWRGTTLHIGQKLIREMEELGADAQNIRVVIGPHIGVCCYEVDDLRAEVFQKEWGGNSGVVEEKNGISSINLGKANYLDLLSAGLKPEHIDLDSSSCTYSNTQEFYSFRRSGLPLPGETMGVIGFRK